MNTQHHLDGFDFGTVISAAGSALKASLPNLVQAGIQKRMAEINAKRAEKIQKAQNRQAAAQAAAQEAALARQEAALAREAGSNLPATTGAGAGNFLRNLPSWVVPALIALVVAFIKLRNGKKK